MSSKNYFDTVAGQWDTMRTGFFPDSVRNKAIQQIDLSPGTKIGDIGCGTGFITEALLKYPVEIYAVDQSAKMLEFLGSKFGDQKQIHFIQSDSENISLSDNSLDFALANMYLHHVERPQESIHELYRILKQGGKLVITDLDKHDYEFLRTEQFDRWLGFEREDINNWFEIAGFRNVRVDCIDSSCCSDSNTTDQRAEISIFIAMGVK